MLPASPNASPRTPTIRRGDATDRFLTGLVIASILYTLLLGWGLLFRVVPFQYAYLLMAFACLPPALWFAYGFLRVAEATQDFGLLLSSLGWLCVFIGLLAKHMALAADLRARALGTLVENLGQSQTALVFLLLGLSGLLLGALISARAWVQAARRGEID